MSKIVVGLDIGTTKIACFVGRKNEHGKIEIISMGKTESLGVRRGMVSNIHMTIDSIKGAVKEAEERAEGDLKISSVYVGIAGEHIKSIQHRGVHTRKNTEDEISQADLDRLVADMYRLAMPPGDEIITVLPQEYIIDEERGIEKPIGMPGVRMEANFHIITGNVTATKNIKRCVDRSGLQVQDIILEPIASSDAVLTPDEKEDGVVLVDIGGGTTDVAIFHRGIIRHTAVIPLGGDVITEDIREGCNIMKRQAEKLKQKFGSALVSKNKENEVVAIPGLRGRPPKEITIRNLSSIIQARMEEIIDLVYYQIQSSGLEKKINNGVVVTGGGAKLKHIKQLFEVRVGMDARIGYPTEHLANTNNEEMMSPIYSTGIGLVLKGFESSSSPVAEFEAASTGNVQTHSEKSRGKFFSKILEKTKEWFAEDDE